MFPKLYITLYRDMARDSNNQLIGAPMTPPIDEQEIDICHESVSGHPFPKYTHFICVKAEADCCIAIGEDAVADPHYHFIEAGERLFYGVREGHQIAVIDSTIKDGNDGSHDDGPGKEEVSS